MIREYFRPATVEEAVQLLTQENGILKPLGGGTYLSRHPGDAIGIVDLQNAGLDKIETRGQRIVAGAMARLSDLLDHPDVQDAIKEAILLDASLNIRNAASLGGWLISSDARSTLSTVLLALDASLAWEPDNNRVRMGNWLPLRAEETPGVLLTEVEWWLRPRVVFEVVARSPKDRPTLIVAAAQWESGRTRIVLGGYGAAPIVAMNGPEDRGADVAARDAYYEAEDQWATAVYRREVASKLALRCLDRIDALKESEA